MKRRADYRRHRHLSFESLEPRTVLSASVPSAGEPQIPPPQASAHEVTNFVLQPAGHAAAGASHNKFVWNPGSLPPGTIPYSSDAKTARCEVEIRPEFTEPAVAPSPKKGIAGLTPRPNLLPLVSDLRLIESANTSSKYVSHDESLSNELNAPLRPEWKDAKSEVFANFWASEEIGDELKNTTTRAVSGFGSEGRERDELDDGGSPSLLWKLALTAFLSTE
jgi:hypothetical protein